MLPGHQGHLLADATEEGKADHGEIGRFDEKLCKHVECDSLTFLDILHTEPCIVGRNAGKNNSLSIKYGRL